MLEAGVLNDLLQRSRGIQHQGFSAKIWVLQFTGNPKNLENWFVPHTTPLPVMTGLGSGVAAE